MSLQRSAQAPRKLKAGDRAHTREPSALSMLTHFTRAAGTKSAMDNLDSILRDGVIRGATRMIRGKRPVVCLFDATIAELGRLLVPSNRRRYEPFGVAFDKRYAFATGARPVFYMPWREARLILAEEEWWRVAAIDLERNPPIDWSYEREWRVAGDLPLPTRAAVALVESWRDADELYDRFDGRPPCAGVMPITDLPGFV
ncbi:MAG: hypothetical protein QOK03_1464 [Candidatus Binataceae bacterium]|nr:hypothetical protein [Candidatus Binataceae bacterium]